MATEDKSSGDVNPLDGRFAKAAHDQEGQLACDDQMVEGLWFRMEAKLQHQEVAPTVSAASSQSGSATGGAKWYQLTTWLAAACMFIALGFGFLNQGGSQEQLADNSPDRVAVKSASKKANENQHRVYPQDSSFSSKIPQNPSSVASYPQNNVNKPETDAPFLTSQKENLVASSGTANRKLNYPTSSSKEKFKKDGLTDPKDLIQANGGPGFRMPDTVGLSPTVKQVLATPMVAHKPGPAPDEMDIAIEVRPSSKRDRKLAKLEPDLRPEPEVASPPKTSPTSPSWLTKMNEWRKGRSASESAESDTIAKPRFRILRQ